MTTALLCPGQGSQRPGMAARLYDEWEPFRTRFDALDSAAAEAALESSLTTLCFEADADRLRRTEYTQPAVYAVGAAAGGAILEASSLEVTAVAGHSLGHFTAAAVAGLFSPRDGLSLVRRRGLAMERAAADSPGRMVAVLVADPGTVGDVCAGIDRVSVAAYNTDRQTVISGHGAAVTEALDRLREHSRRLRTSDLDVGAAFHSPLMADATEPVQKALQRVTWRPARYPVVSDVTAEPYINPRVARADLVEQVTAPVRWSRTVDTLRERGVDRYVELPPAGTLSAFVERRHPDATVIALESPADVNEITP